jgi:hypothetical protein
MTNSNYGHECDRAIFSGRAISEWRDLTEHIKEQAESYYVDQIDEFQPKHKEDDKDEINC